MRVPRGSNGFHAFFLHCRGLTQHLFFVQSCKMTPWDARQNDQKFHDIPWDSMNFHEEFRHPAHLEFSECQGVLCFRWDLLSKLWGARSCAAAAGSAAVAARRDLTDSWGSRASPNPVSSLWKPGGFNMARMMMTQIYTECTCYSWIGKHIHRFLKHNFFMYHKYIHIQNNYCRYCRCFEDCKTWACETSSFSALRLVLTRVEVCVVGIRGGVLRMLCSLRHPTLSNQGPDHVKQSQRTHVSCWCLYSNGVTGSWVFPKRDTSRALHLDYPKSLM